MREDRQVPTRVWILTKDRGLEQRLGRALARLRDTSVHAGDAARLETEGVDLVIASEEVLPRDRAAWVRSLRRLPAQPEVAVFQRSQDPPGRAALLSAGCGAVLHPAATEVELRSALRVLIEQRQATAGLRRSAVGRGRKPRLDQFIAESPAMRSLVSQAEQVARADSSLLILGETGAGKEWLARAIHAASNRSQALFVPLNCAALPETLLESELFGHERGAFTGAEQSRRGDFELAHGGTLFLDEIGDLPPSLQAKLLRVLEDRRVRRLGSERYFRVDVRMIAATSRDLDQARRDGAFRDDLYFRLAVISLLVPPLRERRQDIPILARRFFDEYRNRLGRNGMAWSEEYAEVLLDYEWPGNVRELRNAIERAVLLAHTPQTLRLELRLLQGGSPDPGANLLASLLPDWQDQPVATFRRRVLDELERRYLDHQLRRTGGRVGETARRCGIAERTLFEKMRRLGLRKEDYRVSRTPPKHGDTVH